MKKEAGQSTIEFILCFAFGMGFIFLFANLAITFVSGYLVHYATFMASRNYLVMDVSTAAAGPVESRAQQSARDVITRYPIARFGVDGSNVRFNSFTDTNRSAQKAVMVGVYTTYEMPMSFLPLVGGDTTAQMTSESFLGKEPPRIDCLVNTCKAITDIYGSDISCSTLDVTVVDNGC